MRYYLDCEFDGYRGRLLSLAMVLEDGPELYLAWPRNDCVAWVAENVIPVITAEGATPHIHRIEAWPALIETFLRDDTLPTIVADWPDDIRYLCELMVIGPGEMICVPAPRDIGDIQFVVSRVDAYPTDLAGAVQHNALWDARALRRKLYVPADQRR